MTILKFKSEVLKLPINPIKEKKKKSNNMAVNVTKISQKMKKSKLVEYRKKYKMRKNAFFLIIRKYFNLENFASLNRKG